MVADAPPCGPPAWIGGARNDGVGTRQRAGRDHGEGMPQPRDVSSSPPPRISDPDTARSVAVLLEQRAAFRGFLRQHLADDAAVDDLLQISLIKAIDRSKTIRARERMVPWFYRLLRRELVDHYRSVAARRRRDDAWQQLMPARPDAAMEQMVCGCFEALIPRLTQRAGELLRRVELQGERVSRVATDLGLTPAAATVALHRARSQLRRELVRFCGDCTQRGCLDCDCAEKNA